MSDDVRWCPMYDVQLLALYILESTDFFHTCPGRDRPEFAAPRAPQIRWVCGMCAGWLEWSWVAWDKLRSLERIQIAEQANYIQLHQAWHRNIWGQEWFSDASNRQTPEQVTPQGPRRVMQATMAVQVVPSSDQWSTLESVGHQKLDEPWWT